MKIKSIRKCEAELTVDFEVKDSHTYQLSNGVISHNTSSLLLGTSSGIHSWFADYYIRRIKLNKQESIYKYIKRKLPELIEDDHFNPNQDAFLTIPIKAPEGAITSDKENAEEFLKRIFYIKENWINPGHIKGDNTHNISATIYIQNDEWDKIGEILWENKDKYNGLAFLPISENTYIQAPHEKITFEKYEELMKYLKEIDLSEIKEEEDKTTRAAEIACSATGCAI